MADEPLTVAEMPPPDPGDSRRARDRVVWAEVVRLEPVAGEPGFKG